MKYLKKKLNGNNYISSNIIENDRIQDIDKPKDIIIRKQIKSKVDLQHPYGFWVCVGLFRVCLWFLMFV